MNDFSSFSDNGPDNRRDLNRLVLERTTFHCETLDV